MEPIERTTIYAGSACTRHMAQPSAMLPPYFVRQYGAAAFPSRSSERLGNPATAAVPAGKPSGSRQWLDRRSAPSSA